MDSRQYIFIYPLKANADIPADFPQEVRACAFETGVFVPQDNSNGFARPPRYPARLLLLDRRSVYIVPHPASDQCLVEIKLDELLQLETGCILLFGWMRFTTPAGVQELTYNTRGSQPLEDFLALLKRRWFETTPHLPKGVVRTYGNELDIKFTNSSHFELDCDETVVAQYFQAPVPFEKKFLLFRRLDCRPGNLLLLTSSNRLLWITDQYKQRRELYVSVSFSAPFILFQNSKIGVTDGQRHVEISFSSGLTWRIPAYGVSDESLAICKVLNEISVTADTRPVYDEMH
ncbi:MAG TPA: hypothetical protein VHZ07_14830 [Bryobacteraceae bacterium]|nr:hypothetical protein [Bryobacteraceae bacterium]